MDPSILYEDSELLIIDKPPGMVVNRAESVKGQTVQDWAEKRFRSQIANLNVQKNIDAGHWSLGFGHCDFCNRAGIVHRIDKETSGILLIAKTPQSFYELQRQFKERIVKKTYMALVHGRVTPEEGEIRAPIGRLPWNRERFGIIPGGKEAVTRYRVIATRQSAGKQSQEDRHILLDGTRDDISVVEVYPETGRTHQIRVHLKYINHPILGDWLYAGRKTARYDRSGGTRVMLHAWKISFLQPAEGKPVAIACPIPDDMKRIINPTNTTNMQISK